jgi:hypothetical protein
VIFTKEMMAPAPLIRLVIALTRRPDGSSALPVVSRRNIALFATAAVASITSLVPILMVFLQASPIPFTSKYSSEMQIAFRNPGDLVVQFLSLQSGSETVVTSMGWSGDVRDRSVSCWVVVRTQQRCESDED